MVPAPTGSTRVAAVIGDPVRHSLSPIIHNAGFAAAGLDWSFVAFAVREGSAADAIRAMRTLGIEGLSVTMPHKTAVAAAVDELTDAARALDAVNCVFRRNGTLVGDNTDGTGFIEGLARDFGRDAVAGRRCAVIGAGGAARAVVRALAEAGASQIVVVNRSSPAAARAAALGGTAGGPEAIADAELVVNATPLGMAGSLGEALPCPLDLVGPSAVAVDLVYNPLETPWLRGLRQRGIQAHNGLSMLVLQAAGAFVRWTGHEAPIEAMFAAVAAFLKNPPRDP